MSADAELVDLHCHSSASMGGNDSPAKLARYFAERGYAGFSITDHDTWRGIESAAAAADWLDIAFVPGVEITCRITADDLMPPGSNRSRSIHVLAFDFGPTRDLAQQVDKAFERTREWISEGFRRLRQEEAIAIEADALWQITEDLYGPDPAFKSPWDCPYLLGVALASDGHLRSGEAPHRGARRLLESVYPSADLPPLPTASDVCAAIADAGGVSILAHPGKWIESPPTDRERRWLERWLSDRVDGLEIYHPANSEAHRSLMRDLVSTRERPFTGGSDCHNVGVDEAVSDAPLDCLESLRAFAETHR